MEGKLYFEMRDCEMQHKLSELANITLDELKERSAKNIEEYEAPILSRKRLTSERGKDTNHPISKPFLIEKAEPPNHTSIESSKNKNSEYGSSKLSGSSYVRPSEARSDLSDLYTPPLKTTHHLPSAACRTTRSHTIHRV